ncbi:uncharacterized protein LOC129606133 [Condylostylus longicornis]|uniref:uncharacterized protein LOC129606133 n=1 Tax=Condylostylus longicornis TaxID=2530218 RepID=UPI00244E31B0|nr:uncharacterized protein LOC129606133 [Condylostylus longicornis]
MLYEAYSQIKRKLKNVQTPEIKKTIPTVFKSDITEKIAFLKQNYEPWESVKKYWSETHLYRMQDILSNKDKDFTISKYFETYPILKSQKGYILLCKDFEILHENNQCSNKLFAKWDEVNKNIINYSKTKHMKVFESVKDSRVLTEKIDSRRKLCAEKKETLQPFIAFIGDTFASIQNAYVIIDNIIYKLDNPISAIDVCFKCFSALHAKFPQHCFPVWQFIQLYIYEIQTEFDKKFTTLNSLITDLDQLCSTTVKTSGSS